MRRALAIFLALIPFDQSLAQGIVAGSNWMVFPPPAESEDQPYSCRAIQIASLLPWSLHVVLPTGQVMVSVGVSAQSDHFDPTQVTGTAIGFDDEKPSLYQAEYSDPTGTIDTNVPATFLDDLARAKLMFYAVPGLGAATIDLEGSGQAVQALRTCSTANESTDSTLNWRPLRTMTGAPRGLIRLEEDESVDDVFVAEGRILETTPVGKTDSLFVHHRSSVWCGSAGCALDIFLIDISSTTPLLSITVDEVGLGKGYNLGHRNLRFDDAVTWIWDGDRYVLQ